ncbi:MAG TPA: chemotaxis protein CheA [Candidatus Acidoferrum sp.]|nr:chemotaxis protein CheA [Candidatus Acidoferrum sp.]
MTNPPDERGAELRELFFETSQELLQALNEETLKLEKTPGDEEIVRSIRRTVHTLKGDSAACGLRELSELAHLFEDALTLESAACHGALAEIAFAAADVFAEMLASYHSGAPMPNAEPLRQRISELTAAPAAKKSRRKKKSVEPAPKFGNDWTEAEKGALARAQAAGLALYNIVVKIDPLCTMPIAARQLIQTAISGLGQVIVVRPDAKSPAASKQVEFVFASVQSKEQIAAKCHIPTITGDLSVTLIEAASPGPAFVKITEPTAVSGTEIAASAAAPSATPASATVASISTASAQAVPAEAQAPAPEPTLPQALTENILRVEAGRIDNVLNLVGELIIGKSMLQQALSEFGKRYPKELLRGKFADAMAFQARVLNDLQRSVMKIRMVPVDQLFRRFPRIVRDVARQCGREVDLELSGQETDLDKGILDAIAEPLTHLVRNAVSHGIESAEQRRAQGKSPRGKIRLNAYHQGNQVVVEIGDDGRGIDAQMIRRKAIDLGMTTAEEAARLTEAETLDFIFRPGFSTAEVVTEVSGRGVGMDVVQSVLTRLKATIHVETHLGQGTTFRLKLPLTLAIIKALMFWVEQRLYAIPLNAVSQIARTFESEVHQVDNYEVLQLRNQVLPLLRLGRASAAEIDGKPRKLFVLVINVGERKYGLVVDTLEGEEELVIKALDDQTFATDLVNGASILGDGKVVLILNLLAVVEHAGRMRPEAPGLTNCGLLLNHADRARLALNAAGGQA